MADATVSRLGQVNLAGDALALFLKVFAGEVITSFNTMNVAAALHMIRSITSGKSAQFPVLGKAAASYHTPGAEIAGGQIAANERTIAIDGLLIAPLFIAQIDEAMNHYDVRSEYSRQAGEALAKVFDQQVLQVLVLAARAAATITGLSGGTALTNAAYTTDGAVLASGIFAAAQTLDEKDVPEDGERYAIFKPAQYSLLAQTTDVINRDWGGAGVYSEGKVLKVSGVSIVKSNNLPTTNIITGPTAYQGNFSTTAGVVFHRSAAGTVKLLDLATEAEYDIRRQGTLIVSKYAVGHGILRPESSVELKTA